MKRFLVIFLIIVGCGPHMYELHQSFRAENRANLNRLELGMTKDDVFKVMGNYIKEVKDLYNNRDVFTNPYRTSVFEVKSEKIEILYYHTDVKDLDGAVSDDELTPLVLIDGKLTGWGWDYWNDTALKLEIRIR